MLNTLLGGGSLRFVLGRRRDNKSPLEHKDLSVDQNPNDPEEQRRIEKAGGYVGREDDKSEVCVRVCVRGAFRPRAGAVVPRALETALRMGLCFGCACNGCVAYVVSSDARVGG